MKNQIIIDHVIDNHMPGRVTGEVHTETESCIYKGFLEVENENPSLSITFDVYNEDGFVESDFIYT